MTYIVSTFYSLIVIIIDYYLDTCVLEHRSLLLF